MKLFSSFRRKHNTVPINLDESYDKVCNTILSAKNPQQLENSYRLLHNFFILYSVQVGKDTYRLEGDSLVAFEELLEVYRDRKQVFLND